MSRYVVSFPPAIVSNPPGPSTTRCSRDVADGATSSAAARSSGRRPAQVATTSRGERRAVGKNQLAERSRYTTSSPVARTSSGEVSSSVSVVPM